FAATFSLVVLFVLGARLRAGTLLTPTLLASVSALFLVSVFPIVWMVASYVVLGDWLPALHVTNAFMVGTTSAGGAQPHTGALVVNQSPYMAQISMAVLAVGAFPFEIGLSIAGAVWSFRTTANWSQRAYLFVVVGTILLFVVAFKGRLPASLVF